MTTFAGATAVLMWLTFPLTLQPRCPPVGIRQKSNELFLHQALLQLETRNKNTVGVQFYRLY